MKGIKKIISVILCVVMIFGSAPLAGFVGLELPSFSDLFVIKAKSATYEGACGENLIWTLDTVTGELIVSGIGEMSNYSSTSSPFFNYRFLIKSIVINDGVTNIGDYSFRYCGSLTSIMIPETLTSIGNYAFDSCSNLTCITIPFSIMNIGDSAFDYCENLDSFIVDSANTMYSNDENGVLYNKDKTQLIKYPEGNKETSYTILGDVTNIGISSFHNCNNIENIIISDGVTKIGDYAFSSCSNLKNVTIPNSITSIGKSAFQYCSSLEVVEYIGSESQWNGITIGDYNTNLLEVLRYRSLIGTCGDNITWSLDTSTGELFIVGTGEMKSYSSPSDVPWHGKCSSIKYVTISNGIINIGDYIFYNCNSLTNIIVPDSVTNIGNSAFYNCDNLENTYYVGTPEQWETISIGSSNNDLISNGIIYECNSEKPYYFGYCGEDLIWNLDVETGELFISGTGNMYDWFEYDYYYNKYTTPPWYEYRNLIKTISFSDSVTSIGNAAFVNCNGLIDITIPDGITTIGSEAFRHCFNLKNVIISDSVSTIKTMAFYECHMLTDITIGDNVSSFARDAFLNSGKYNDELSWENGVLYIGKYLIDAKTSITGEYCIKNDTVLIADYAFQGCTSLTDIIISDSVKYIGVGSFVSLSNLSSITIGNNLISVCDRAFNNCSNLVKVYYSGTPEQWNNIFIGLYNEPIANNFIVFECKSESPYCYKGNCGDNLIWLFDENGELIIRGSGDMANWTSSSDVPWDSIRSSIRTVIIENGVTNIGYNAFYNCNNLVNVLIPDTVINIGSNAFDNTGIFNDASNWENDVLYINHHLIKANSSLSGDYEIKEGTLTIAESAFLNCDNLTGVVIPGGVTNIGNSAFSSCKNLTCVIIPYGVTSINAHTFSWCDSLSAVTIPNTVTSINNSAFYSCSGLTDINIPDSVTSIGNDAFHNCRSLSNVIIGKSVESIGDCAFAYCISLTNVAIPDGIKNIGEGAFGCCDGLKTVTISKSVTNIGENAFYSCYYLTDVYYIGFEKDWNAITIGIGNSSLVNATIHFEHIHSYTFFVEKEVSCTDSGLIFFVCKCGDSYTEEIAKTSHNEGEWEIVTEATCTAFGKKVKKCTVCSIIIKSEIIPFDKHSDSNGDGLCDICDKISNVELVKDIYISIFTPENRTINYMESVKLYATTANLPEGYKIKWKVEGEGVSIKPSVTGRICTVTSTSSGNVVIKAYVVDSNGNIVKDENGKQICDSEYFYSEANLWLRIVFFFKKLFGISMTTAQAFKGIF